MRLFDISKRMGDNMHVKCSEMIGFGTEDGK